MAKKDFNFTVIKRFRDKDDKKVFHEVGDDVAEFTQNRLEDLIERGFVEKTEKEPAASKKGKPEGGDNTGDQGDGQGEQGAGSGSGESGNQGENQ